MAKKVDADILISRLGTSEKDTYCKKLLQEAPAVRCDWIPVNEALPNEFHTTPGHGLCKVWVTYTYDVGGVTKFRTKEVYYLDKMFTEDGKKPLKNVIAWMYVPGPYTVPEETLGDLVAFNSAEAIIMSYDELSEKISVLANLQHSALNKAGVVHVNNFFILKKAPYIVAECEVEGLEFLEEKYNYEIPLEWIDLFNHKDRLNKAIEDWKKTL